MPRVIHFEIQAKMPDRAARFYKDVFGWKIEKWGGGHDYWMIITGSEDEAGINGGLMREKMGNKEGSSGYVCLIAVPSVDFYVAKILENGGKVVEPKMVIPGTGYLAYCNDTEGNTFGIIQLDEDVE